MEIVAIDIGGTHARFARAEVAHGRVETLEPAVTLKTSEHASLQMAWAHYSTVSGGRLPRAAAIAVAGPVSSKVFSLTNSPWIIDPERIHEILEVDAVTLVNDFEAVGHAVAQAPFEAFEHLAGPVVGIPRQGITSIIGPGTGLGVAQLWRGDGDYRVQATEGGHIGFVPCDEFDDLLLKRLRKRHGRVSVERVVSGPAIVDIFEAFACMEKRSIPSADDREIWAKGLSGSDKMGVAAIERFCMSLGSVAGDIALAQGANGVVIAGGLGLRIRDVLLKSGFAQRFTAKGRFEALMTTIPVKIITHPQPGLLGAAAGFSMAHGLLSV